MDMPESRTWNLPFTETPVLELDASAAALDVVPVAPGETPRLVASRGRGDFPVEVSEKEGVVHLRIGVPDFSGFSGLRWATWRDLGRSAFGLTLHLPSHIRARLRTDFGRVRVEHLQGCDLQVATHAGALQLNNVKGRLVLRADAGQIRGEHLGGTFDVESGMGEVRLSIDAIDPGPHRIRSSMGSVRAELAAGLSVRVETRTVMGSVRNSYPVINDAAAQLLLEADLGSVRVSEVGAPDDGRHGDWPNWSKLWAEHPWPHGSPGSDHFWRQWPFERTQRPDNDRAPQRPARSGANDEELHRILSMVEKGTLTAQDAERLIRAIEGR